MLCWSGSHDPLDPKGGVNLLDVVMGMGREGRFGRFGNNEWTVLHHSFFVFLIYIKLFGRVGSEYAALHDAHEAYHGDIPAPVKRYLRDRSEGSDALADVEHEYDAAIARFLEISMVGESGTDRWFAARIKVCDRVALVIEARLFGPPGSSCWSDIPDENKPEVRNMVFAVMPDFERVCAARGVAPFPEEA